MHSTRPLLYFCLILVCALLCTLAARAQTTEFTYQGRLTDNGAPATGLYDVQFTVFDALTGGNAVGEPQIGVAVPVTNGVFSVTLDFGAGVFTGANRFLELAVRTNTSPNPHATLSPRQPVTSTPYAIQALRAATADSVPAANVTGTLSDARLSLNVPLLNAVNTFTGTNLFDGSNLFTGMAIVTNGGNVFKGTFFGNGAGLTNLPVASLAGIRTEPNVASGAPNIINGTAANFVAPGTVGATISGGGTTNYFGGVFSNSITGDFSFIGGGYDNAVRTGFGVLNGGRFNAIESGVGEGVIAGGIRNQIEANATRAVIGGGEENKVQSNAGWSMIGGGSANTISATEATIGGGFNNLIGAQQGTIGGGSGNRILITASGGVIDGGYNHLIEGNAYSSTIGGGNRNTIHTNAHSSTISGGDQNTVRTNASITVIGGGANNTIENSAQAATINGGFNNTVRENGQSATIGGGGNNSIQTNGFYGTIPGGRQNLATNYAFAAGRRAKAVNTGAFVWADSTDADFSSTTNNQFNVRASGGVRMETGGAGLTVDGSRVLTEAAGGAVSGLRTFVDATSGSFNMLAGSGANRIDPGVLGASINGGAALYNGLARSNVVTGDFGTVGGGMGNVAAFASTTAGGNGNLASGGAASIGGGDGNVASGIFSTIPGGRLNTATDNAFAAGNRAKAIHNGSFVWADATPQGDFSSTAAHQVLFRTAGGMGINKNDPTSALDVNGTVTALNFVGSGAGLTNITLDNVVSGTIPDTSLSTNVVLRSGNQTFSNRVMIGTGSYVAPFSVQSDGTANGGRSGQNEVTARFRNTAGGTSAISIDAPTGQDAALYLSENNSALWSLRHDSSDFQKFNLRYHGGGVDNTVLTAHSSGEVNIGSSAVSGSLSINSTGSTLATLDSSDTTGTRLKLSNTSTGGKEWSVLSTGNSHSQGAGKLVLSAPQGSSPQATLDTSGNLSVAGNLTAKNLPALAYAQGDTGPPVFGEDYTSLPFPSTNTIDEITVTVPRNGVLMLQAQMLLGGIMLSPGATAYFSLEKVPSGGGSPEYLVNDTFNHVGGGIVRRDRHYEKLSCQWVLPVTAGNVTIRGSLAIFAAEGSTVWVKSHNLTAVFFAVSP